MPAARPAPPQSGEVLREQSVRDIIGALNAVVGFAHLLAGDEGQWTEEQRARYASHVREGARTLLRLVPAAVGIDAGPMSAQGALLAPPPAAASFPPAERLSSLPAPSQMSPDTRARVFVADPDPRARELIAAFLERGAYDVTLLESGRAALECAESAPPDLVLLDASSDDSSRIARALKRRDPYLPVVFMTPLGDGGARLRALEAGAEQFIEKPLNRHELRARVRNLLVLRRNQRALAAQNEQLRSLQAFKDEMAALMVHDLKSPLSAIAMNLDVALSALPEDGALEDVRAALEDCRMAGGRLFRMIANLLDIARSEDGRLAPRATPVDLRQLVEKIAVEHAVEARLRHVNLTCTACAEGLFELDPDLVGRVIENLIENGLRYTRPSGHLTVFAHDRGDVLEIRVANDGPPIPIEHRASIFEKYGQIAAGARLTRANRGLGLYFCRVAAEAHGGAIALDDEPGMTTCFSVTLARKPALAPA